jgi:hypothetical protein
MGRSQRTFIVFVMAILALGTAAILYWNSLQPPSNSLVGMTRREIIAVWGQPGSEWEGHYGRPRKEDPLHPVRSLMIERGNWDLYASFYQEGDEWICFISSWIPKGAVF